MTSITAPRIDANLPATPAHEWATETSSKLEETKVAAIDDSSSHPPPLATAISTPGAEFPGSYPRGEKETEEGGQSGILDAAKQYLPGQQDVQGALLNATETAKQYLPTSVAAYLPGGGNKEKATTTTLPSQEGPLELSHEGVGSLPGNASETSVAKLPEEREIRDKEMTTMTTLPSQDGPQKPLERSDGVGSLPGNASESSVAQLPEERATGMNTTTTLPTQEGAQKPSEHSGGIGSLPGNASESSVAKLPGEAQATAMTTSDLTPATSGEKMQSHSESVSNSSMQAQLGETPTMTPVLGGHRTPIAVSGVGDHKSESTLAERKPEEGNAHSEPNLNLMPRTHPLGAKGAQWKGAAVDEDKLKKMDAHETRDRDDVVNLFHRFEIMTPLNCSFFLFRLPHRTRHFPVYLLRAKSLRSL
ncbi:hypothetical protein E1B28_003599 [Marasmius oreades]|uniref:Uncharacterized protein n=1 Tax=Marasmius oreades TaxID=181124 RepID=A0A9P7RLY7_9AGAR|nr:uncharacterized protein E1B28_003599 [Marasmius oreades]KAG7086084.1 hypothetical protein E1B28_003599 [Marasmius oreades]